MTTNTIKYLLVSLFLLLFINNTESRDNRKIIDSLKHKSQVYTNPDSITKAYIYLSVVYRRVSMDSAILYGKIAVEKSQKAIDPLTKGKAYLLYGTNLADAAKYQESLEQLFRAEKLIIESKDDIQLGNVYTNIGRTYNYMADYKNAIDYYYKGVKICERAELLSGEVTSRMNLITIYIAVKEFDEAEKLSKELYPKVIQLKDSSVLCSYHMMYAAIFLESNPDKSLENYLKALPLAIKHNKFEIQAYIEMSIAQLYIERYRKNSKEEDYQLSLKYFDEGKKTCETHKVVAYLAECYNSLGELALIKNDAEKCISYSYQALQMEAETNIKSNILHAYNNIYRAYEKLNIYDSSLYYLKKVVNLKEELTKNEIKSKMMGEELDYRVEKNNAINKAAIAEKERDITIRNSIIIILSCLALIVILLISFLYMRYQRGRQKEFSIMLIQTQEEERKRISKDLHDGIGQNLLMIKSECGNNTPLVEITIDELRTISRNLHPVQLEKLGLKEALESVVDSAEKSSSIFFSHEIEDINSLLDNNQQINLYRTIQECLSNIIKHSKAKAARITVEKQKNNVIATIYDDGVGFNISEMKKKKSLGLTSISERVKLMDGTLTIMSGTKGTRVEIKIDHG